MDGIKIRFGGVLHRLKNVSARDWFLVVEVLLMAAICVLHALPAGHYVNFYPINGTFQNYNPVRRLLDGQVPYSDFTDYLGMGHLYIGTLMTVLFGGDYRGSLIAFSFLAFFGLASLSLMAGKAILKRSGMALAATNLVLLMLVVQPLFYVNAIGLTGDVLSALNYALGTGNSARFVRGLALPVTVALLCLGERFYRRYNGKLCGRLTRWLPAIGTGLVAGFAFTWSNDYGVSCWVCLAVMTFWVSLSRLRKLGAALMDAAVEVVASLAGLFVFVEIFTLGHFSAWFKSIFGTGGYQSWYYNSAKSYYLFDVDFSYLMLVQALLAVVYMVFLFVGKADGGSLKRYGVPGFANMVCFCAVNEYRILSGGGSREVALSMLFLTVIFELARLFLERKKLWRVLCVSSLVIGFAWTVSAVKEEVVFRFVADKDGKYAAYLGGNMTSLYDDLESADKFLDGAEFWATYASAQEVMEGKFQPSGTDYIIHVLGDEQRRDYLAGFRKGDFRYAVTIRKGYTDWEYWAERANWFFYRELYQGWHPVYANTYEMYWERNNAEEEHTLSGDYEVEAAIVDDSTVKLMIRTDRDVNGIADVYIDYSVNRKQGSRLAGLLFRTVLKVENTGTVSAGSAYYESNYLRSGGAEYIPMPVTDGYGELTLTASPARSACLDFRQVSCSRIYTAANDILRVQNLTDGNWNGGVSVSGPVLLFGYSDTLLERLEGAEQIRAGNDRYDIKDIDYDTDWIRVTVDGDASACCYPAILVLGGK